MFVCSFYRAVIIITFTRWQVYLYNYENWHKRERKEANHELEKRWIEWENETVKNFIGNYHHFVHWFISRLSIEVCKLISDIFDVALLTSNTNRWNVWIAKSIYFYFYIYLIGQISINKLTKSIMFNLSQHHHKNSSENFAHFSFFSAIRKNFGRLH